MPKVSLSPEENTSSPSQPEDLKAVSHEQYFKLVGLFNQPFSSNKATNTINSIILKNRALLGTTGKKITINHQEHDFLKAYTELSRAALDAYSYLLIQSKPNKEDIARLKNIIQQQLNLNEATSVQPTLSLSESELANCANTVFKALRQSAFRTVKKFYSHTQDKTALHYFTNNLFLHYVTGKKTTSYSPFLEAVITKANQYKHFHRLIWQNNGETHPPAILKNIDKLNQMAKHMPNSKQLVKALSQLRSAAYHKATQEMDTQEARFETLMRDLEIFFIKHHYLDIPYKRIGLDHNLPYEWLKVMTATPRDIRDHQVRFLVKLINHTRLIQQTALETKDNSESETIYCTLNQQLAGGLNLVETAIAKETNVFDSKLQAIAIYSLKKHGLTEQQKSTDESLNDHTAIAVKMAAVKAQLYTYEDKLTAHADNILLALKNNITKIVRKKYPNKQTPEKAVMAFIMFKHIISNKNTSLPATLKEVQTEASRHKYLYNLIWQDGQIHSPQILKNIDEIKTQAKQLFNNKYFIKKALPKLRQLSYYEARKLNTEEARFETFMQDLKDLLVKHQYNKISFERIGQNHGLFYEKIKALAHPHKIREHQVKFLTELMAHVRREQIKFLNSSDKSGSEDFYSQRNKQLAGGLRLIQRNISQDESDNIFDSKLGQIANHLLKKHNLEIPTQAADENIVKLGFLLADRTTPQQLKKIAMRAQCYDDNTLAISQFTAKEIEAIGGSPKRYSELQQQFNA